VPLRDWVPLMGQMRLWRHWRDAFDLVVANSQATRRRLEADGLAVDDVVPNGVAEWPARPPLAGPPTVAFAGRLVPEKGVDVLLRAFARVAGRLPDARLLVAGDGPERGRLDALAASLGLAERATFLGHLSRPDAEAAFGGAWVQAIPSTWEEPAGVVAMEAAIRGTAVVASATGGLVEAVSAGETGLLVPPGDEQAMAAALSALLADRGQAERLGQQARARARAEFTVAACADRFLELYGRIGAGVGGGPAYSTAGAAG
jgi:glycosyltransferase involved in cell wall biosynthesis